MKNNIVQLLIFVLCCVIISTGSSQAQINSDLKHSKVEYETKPTPSPTYAGFQSYYMEFNFDGFNESEQVYKGIVKLVEHINVEKYDTLGQFKAVTQKIYDQNNEEFTYNTKQILNEDYGDFKLKAIDEEYLNSIIKENKEEVLTNYSMSLVLYFNGQKIEFYDHRELSLGKGDSNPNEGKEIETVEIKFNNDVIFHRINENVSIENTVVLASALKEFKIQAEKAKFKIIRNDSDGRTSVRYYGDM